LNSLSPAHFNHRRSQAILWWLVTFAWAALIFSFSTARFSSSWSARVLAQILSFLHVQVAPHTFNFLHHLIRKLAHTSEYAILGLSLYRALRPEHQYRWSIRTAAWVALAAGAYSLTDEFHQSLVPGRTASLLDCGIDTLGAILGLLAIYGVGRLFQANSSRPAASKESTEER
jgi:VanZ family protein